MREVLAELNQMACEIMSVKVVVGGEENSLKGNSRVHRVVLCGSGRTGLEQLLQMEGQELPLVRTSALISSQAV